jgi:hypothetical protein
MAMPLPSSSRFGYSSNYSLPLKSVSLGTKLGSSEIKAKNLTCAQVNENLCVQRVHQNNVEFLSAYFPVMIIAMLGYPMQTANAGALSFGWDAW